MKEVTKLWTEILELWTEILELVTLILITFAMIIGAVLLAGYLLGKLLGVS
jgi:hypothetical protein